MSRYGPTALNYHSIRKGGWEDNPLCLLWLNGKNLLKFYLSKFRLQTLRKRSVLGESYYALSIP